MPYRIAGVLAILVGGGIIAAALGLMESNLAIADVLASQNATWNLPVSREDFLVRSRLWSGVIAAGGALTMVAGIAMALMKKWGLWLSVIAALFVGSFPWLTKVLLSERFHFSAGYLELLVAGVIGLIASLAFMFKPKLGAA